MKEIPQQVSESVRRRNPHLYDNPANHAFMAAYLKAKAQPSKRIRQSTKPLLNKLESEWLNILKIQYPLRDILEQALKFRLANGVWFCPDIVMIPSHYVPPDTKWIAYDVKGSRQMQDDAAVKIKVAAKDYPYIKWVLVWKGVCGWQEQEVLP